MTQVSELEVDPNTGLVYNSLVQSPPGSGMGHILKLAFTREIKSSLWGEPLGEQLLAQDVTTEAQLFPDIRDICIYFILSFHQEKLP